MSKRILGIVLVLILIIGAASYLFVFKQKNQSVSSNTSYQMTPQTIEIFYLPHPPAVAIVRKVEPIITEFPKFTVKEFSFDDPQAKSVIDKYNLTEHMPIVIFIGGKDTFTVDGKSVELKNFPEGDAFAPSFEGGWSYEDLREILKSLN
ncbi:hypothetical protein M1271_03080 [Patescibacteria group bacterium]|nr:hypothetical protein [Patescibacteria group bacterium]MCL5797341.1 hypothetical protein [Patescibacteria group bacterium]